MFEGGRLETCAGEDGPIVVKTATDEAGRDRLAREAQRLEQARHPGVVHLVSADGDRLVLAWAGEQTLAIVRPPVPVAAALLAAVASTVADLHELGLIHGRLDPSHVIIGPDGRPRLCGLAGREPTERVATPADDVAALGHLIDHLLGPGADLEPIPERRWARRRPVSHDRRTLLAVADRATQDDPAQRPTARALALLIVDAVPGARLDRPTPFAPMEAEPHVEPAPAALDPADEVDHLEPGPHLPEPPAVPETTSEPTPTLDDTRDAAAHEPPESMDPVESMQPVVQMVEAIGDGGSEQEPADSPRWSVPLAPEPPEPEEDPAATAARRFLGLRIEPGLATAATSGMTAEPNEAAASVRPSRSRTERSGVRAAPVAQRPRNRVPRMAAAAVAVVAVAVVASAGGWLRVGPPSSASTAVEAEPGSSGADPATTDPAPSDLAPPASATTATTTAEASASTVGCTPVAASTADLDGDGCPDPYRIDGTTILVDGRRWTVGQAGDQVELGDWDCDGRATPAVLRPATGEVFLFARWPEADQPLTVDPATVLVTAERFAAADPGASCGPPRVLLSDGRDVAVSGTGAQP